MRVEVGEVVAVTGVKVTIRIHEESSKDTLFHNGEKYRGVSIREYVTVQRGFKDVVCLIEGEYLDERYYEEEDGKRYYVRKVEARPIGHFSEGRFHEGIKYLPMIKDPVFLLQESRVAKIFGKDSSVGLVIGKTLQEEIPIALPWESLFNSHVGVFGNTGSGKSNTLAKLYTVLFETKENAIQGKSNFIVIDFNGEYGADQFLLGEQKTVIVLDTSSSGGGKFSLPETEFWDSETLSILFQATANTQRPFLNRVVNGRNRFGGNPGSLNNYLKKTFELVFSAASPKPEALDLMRHVASVLGSDQLLEVLKSIAWHSKNGVFYIDKMYFNADGNYYEHVFSALVDELDASELDDFNELIVRCNIQLVRDLLHGHVQFEHIQPLLKRMESSLDSLRKVVAVANQRAQDKLVTVISLRRCNQAMKKVLPLLIAKSYYNEHKSNVETPVNKTMHFIIDEAHNILSQQSTREHESWKDYRLELFEEIVKEGRKFGVFLTIASQRPADISSTIISQLHNFFVHRLVNERDLYLIDNAISTLDSLSRSLIPNLARGCCVITGTAFDLPLLLQVDKLDRSKQPDSEDVDLEALWVDA